MSERVFLDTSGWLAAANPKDSHYSDMSEAFDRLLAAHVTFVTSNLVLAEMHALTMRERGPKVALALIDAIYSDPVYRVVSSDRDLESRAVENWLRSYPDTGFSLTDAVSFQVMKDGRITKAFALDRHFEIAGFSLVTSQVRNRSARKRK